MGNLTRDVEVKFTPKGTAVGEFGLAVNRVWKDGQNQKHEETTFFDCQVWGATAETLEKYVKKGDPLFVQGRFRQDVWDDKTTGQKRSKMRVVVEEFQFLAFHKEDDSKGRQSKPSGQPPARPSPPPKPPRDPDLDGFDDDQSPFD